MLTTAVQVKRLLEIEKKEVQSLVDHNVDISLDKAKMTLSIIDGILESIETATPEQLIEAWFRNLEIKKII